MAAPGVSAAAIASSVPMGAGAGAYSFSIEGRPLSDPGLVQDAETFAVSAGYFTTLGIPLKAGRLLQSGDGASAPGAAVISAGDVRNEALAKEPYPQLYLPSAQMPMRSMYLAVRAAGVPVRRTTC
ncbi:hypothetical protein [Archangium sp.]|uniref:hypothetical protein n=1 Tax=Archangium sp. TaxID=1872627 RepID=UPI00286AF213|nr:hypothetical protein [Archangium sp.]